METLPDIREELNRKMVDGLGALYSRYERGQVTSDQLVVAAEAIFSIVSGLCDEDNMTILEDMILDARGVDVLRLRLWRDHEGRVAVVEMEPDKFKLTTKILGRDGKVKTRWADFSDKVNPIASYELGDKRMATYLKSQGFVEW